jgi:hypothetical protein
MLGYESPRVDPDTRRLCRTILTPIAESIVASLQKTAEARPNRKAPPHGD